MLSEENFKELEVKGYTVVPGVVTADKCDSYVEQYRQWIEQFKKGIMSRNAIVTMYNVGHLEPSWGARLDTKAVFTQLWKTDKLLTSFDAIAIGTPPEQLEGAKKVLKTDKHFLHVDQESARFGLHGYQGSVYLEDQSSDDWPFLAIEGSHVHLSGFYDSHPKAAKGSDVAACYMLKSDDITYFEEKGCEIKRVPVPKGSMVVWDSRLVHANANPTEGREHPERWLFAVYVSMTPAIWASEEDMEVRKVAYHVANMTSHWSSQGVRPFKSMVPVNVNSPDKIPENAKSLEAMQLSGATPYDFNDGSPTGEERKPIWR